MCTLNVSGTEFDVDAFLKTSSWKEIATVFRRGEPTVIKSLRKHSGFKLNLSHSEETSFELQIQDVMHFLQENNTELERLNVFPHVDEVEISFCLFWFEDTVCYPISLPAELLLMAGKMGISMMLYVCATSKDDNDLVK